MIPEIGVMIGAYIITRMLSYIFGTGERKEKGLVIVFAGITIVITVIVIIDLLMRGSSIQF